MGKKGLLVISNSNNPFENHAMESTLIRNNLDYEHILYLWVNQKTAVIGRNQNPWREMNVEYACANHVDIIRRISGGGTVYHDSGNLNFSFIESASNYNLGAHFNWIKDAISHFNVLVEITNRKDILCNGKKISGNAFYLKGQQRVHHGTLLVESNLSEMRQLLKMNDDNFNSTCIASKASPTVNLTEINSKITLDKTINAMIDVFYQQMRYDVDLIDPETIKLLYSEDYHSQLERLSSWKWNYGETPTFTYQVSEDSFLTIQNGKIVDPCGNVTNISALEGVMF